MVAIDIGLIGLGVMGTNLALNIAEKGYSVAVFNRGFAQTKDFWENSGKLKSNIIPCQSLQELVNNLASPRSIILMIPAGQAVDDQIRLLQPLLFRQDIIIDAGNADFNDTRRRCLELKEAGLHFIGMGVSGGKEGARNGPSIMVGGNYQAWKHIEPLLKNIAAYYEKESCVAWLGTDGAGHFVKTIHNGIEYADMQMIAEVYGLLRDGMHLSLSEISSLFHQWNQGVLNSYLIEITAKILKINDPTTGQPIVDVIVDRAAQKGTGKWSVIEAYKLEMPVPCIEAAVAARVLSGLASQRLTAHSIYNKNKDFKITDRLLLDHLESALFAGRIIAYAQGFTVMHRASQIFNWQLPLSAIAKIWRAGCIIRSDLLDKIAQSLSNGPDSNLLTQPVFIEIMQNSHPSLRYVVSKAIDAENPVPALSAAITYFDSYKQARSVANLIQAQRDFFGAHSFERIDAEGHHHGPW